MKATAQKMPSFIEPMKALPVEELPEGDWLYEIKHDGYRALAFKDGKEARLISRNNKPLNYPELLASLKLLAVQQVILDGEIVALDEKGRSSFQLLQDYKSSEQCVLLAYYVSDLLFVDGKDLRKELLAARRKLLADILKKAPPNIRISVGLKGSKEDLLRGTLEFGLEGLVAKRLNSVYESGRRTGAWVKVKLTREQEFVVGGYTLPEGSRKHFGSLLVGYHGPMGSRLPVESEPAFRRNLGKHPRTIAKARRATCPFVNLPEKSKGKMGPGMTPAVMKRCHWVNPVLIAQIKFTEWTADNQLRQPVFLRTTD